MIAEPRSANLQVEIKNYMRKAVAEQERLPMTGERKHRKT